MKVGSLFSGIGGLDLGFERAGFEIAWQVEIDPYCRKVLTKHWPGVPKYEDVREVGGNVLESVYVIEAGFPCQDISSAGRGVGIDGERSGLWGEYARILSELRPQYVVVENVTALLYRGLGRVLGDLAALGYDAEWGCFPASAFGAPHARDRLFIVAYPSSVGYTEPGVFGQNTSGKPARLEWQTTDALNAIRRGAVPALCRSNDGLPARLDRLRGLGNAVVPQVAQYVAECVMHHAALANYA